MLKGSSGEAPAKDYHLFKKRKKPAKMGKYTPEISNSLTLHGK
jgi:hypothetical protein